MMDKRIHNREILDCEWPAGGFQKEVMRLTLHDSSQIDNVAGSLHDNRGHSRTSGSEYHEGN